jgi:hypothetical protein
VELRVEVDMAGVMRRLNLMPRAITAALEQAADETTALVLHEMQLYPAQRPPANPRRPYRRTGTLKRSWHRRIRRAGHQVVGEVVSSGAIAPYNVYVQRAPTQARVHRGVWRNTDEEVVRRRQGEVLRIYQGHMRRALGAPGR